MKVYQKPTRDAPLAGEIHAGEKVTCALDRKPGTLDLPLAWHRINETLVFRLAQDRMALPTRVWNLHDKEPGTTTCNLCMYIYIYYMYGHIIYIYIINIFILMHIYININAYVCICVLLLG